MVDWEQERDSLLQAGEKNWWKPEAGQYAVHFLDTGEFFSWTPEGQDKEVSSVKFKIEVNGKQYDWGIPKGITAKSAWGQLVLVAADRGKIQGETISLIVKSRGNEKGKDYTVLEALSLMNPEGKPKEERGTPTPSSNTSTENKGDDKGVNTG